MIFYHSTTRENGARILRQGFCDSYRLGDLPCMGDPCGPAAGAAGASGIALVACKLELTAIEPRHRCAWVRN